MTKFENIGVEKQYASRTVWQADYHHNKSCDLCCFSGMRLSCKQCHIEGAHQNVIKMLAVEKMA